MKIPKKNRFILEQTDHIDLNLDQKKKQKRFRIFLGTLSLLLLLLVATISYYYLEKNGVLPSQNDINLLDRILSKNNTETDPPEYRYYTPKEKLSPELQQAIEHYRAKELRHATVLLEKIINGHTTTKEKAIALIYSGIIAMERDRYELARHLFLRSLHYDPGSIGAIVNLAILEQRLNNYTAAKEYALQARRLAPTDNQVLLLLGNILLEGKNTEDAISTYEKAVQGLPEDALVYYNLALSHLQKQNTASAIEFFTKAIAKSNMTSLIIRAEAHLGQLYFGQGRHNLAIDHLTKATRLAPENARYRYNLGVIYLYKNKPQEAIRHFQTALKTSQGSPSVYRSLAKAFQKLQKEKYAIDALQKALYVNPGDLPALFALGKIQRDLGYLDKAATSYRKIVNITPGDSHTQDALYSLAEVHLDMEKHNSAISFLEKAIGLDANNSRAYLLLGKIYEKSGRRDLSIQAWKKALRSPSQKNKYIMSLKEEKEIRLSLAAVYRKEGLYDLALLQYKLIQNRNQEISPLHYDTKLHIEWAKTYIASQDFASAIPLLEKVAYSKSSNTIEKQRAYLLLAQIYHQYKTNPEGIAVSLNYINRALRLDPKDTRALLMQTSLLILTETAINREKALETLDALVQSESDPIFLAKGYNLMGIAYTKSGEYRRALESLDRSLELDPSNKEAYRNQRTASRLYEQERPSL